MMLCYDVLSCAINNERLVNVSIWLVLFCSSGHSLEAMRLVGAGDYCLSSLINAQEG
jgi:hypothetical protein